MAELPSEDTPSPARAIQLLRRMLSQWRSQGASSTGPKGLLVASVCADQVGGLALARRGREPFLVALVGASPTDRPIDTLVAARCAEGPDAPRNDNQIAATAARLESWLAMNASGIAPGAGHTIAGAARRVAMQRVAHIALRTPRHCRALVAPLAAEARRIITAPYGVGAERILAELAGAPLPDEAWLRAVRAFGEANCRGAGGAASAAGGTLIEALIVFGP
jgi:hypothetical protein